MMKTAKGKGKGKPISRSTSGFGSASASGFGGFGDSGSGSSLSYLAEPPSFSNVTDPHVVVSLKNVLKKDSTTKAKALEELLAFVQDHPFEKDGGVEEAVLDVWVQMYPRTSIDNARRVRELSHNLQFELMKSARKRMERHIPTIVGAWLAGLYDRDRAVARAANDGLASFLNTPEKVLGLWKKCQSQILDYAIEAVQETQDTLSDERSTTKEDAEAKYYRVITASLSLVLGLLQKLSDDDIAKAQAQYDNFFEQDAVWKAITYNDSSVRKTVCHLVFTCLDRKLPCAEETKVRQAIVTGGLRTDQSGSALEYVRALTKLTQSQPAIWTPGTEKKSPLARLQAFIAKGSQGSPPKFWEYLDQLLALIPLEATSLDLANGILTSLKSGVTHRDEPRTNTSYAWKCYIDTARRLLQSLAPAEQHSFGQAHLFPLFEKFILSVSEKQTAIPLGPNAMTIFVDAYVAISSSEEPLRLAFEEEWKRVASILCANISASLPEVSKEYQTSQEKISEEGRRWFGLVGQIVEKMEKMSGSIPDYTTQPSSDIIDQSLSLLQTRNLKPYGAARILEYALSTSQHLFRGDRWTAIADFLMAVAREDMEKAATSSSAPYLLSCVQLLGAVPGRDSDFSALWATWAQGAAQLQLGETQDSTLTSLVSNDKGARLAQQHTELQRIISQRSLATVSGTADAWGLLDGAVTCQALEDGVYTKLAHDLLDLVNRGPGSSSNILRAMEILVKGRPALFSANDELKTALLARLLSLSETGDTTLSTQTQSIRALLDSQSEGKLPIVGIIQSNLDRAGPQSLGIATVLSQAEGSSGIPPEDVFPNVNVWAQELEPFLEQPIDPSLSITSNIGGVAAIIKPSTRSVPRVQRDRKGRSIPARMALFLDQALSSRLDFAALPVDTQAELLCLYGLTTQLVSDQITLGSKDGMWLSLHHGQSASEAENLVSSSKNFINTLAASSDTSETLSLLIDTLIVRSQELSSRGVYSARALAELIAARIEVQGLTPHLEEKLMKTEYLKATPETSLLAAAIVVGVGDSGQISKPISNFCNRLVSDAAGASVEGEKVDKSHAVLALLSLCGQTYETGEMPVANNRIVFATRQITSWLDEPEKLEPSLSAEICRSLTQLLPCMKDVYGQYWEQALGFCIYLWQQAGGSKFGEMLSATHASLRLYKTLSSIAEPNDDLQDALKEFSDTKAKALLELLRAPRFESSQPVGVVDGIICREVEKLPMRHIPDVADIFPLVASESRDIQTAAFNLLHKAIPAQQEQKSVDILLDNTDARLPDELLSLLLDAPTLEQYPDEILAQFPTSIRCYLLAWKLVFDAYSTSSFKVRNDFTEQLRAEKCAIPLLDFMFDVLGHSAAHPLNLPKASLGPEQIKDFDIKLADAEAEEKSMQWLLVHLFYLALKYTPGLFRTWYIDCRSKQTRIAVEGWTTKFFSPLIIDDALDDVQTWADSQEASSMDEKELNVKVSRPAREVTAGYEIDEDEAAIAIKIPSSYPIDGVAVEGLRRVAVDDKKWQSWVRTTRGVITFSNGNIIDGLQVFRRNIVGALKGQGECAICYSIISSDKKTPDKRCTTCKNLFHRVCLYKWFSTSNQNTCPLCRNPIDYLGADTQKRRQG